MRSTGMKSILVACLVVIISGCTTCPKPTPPFDGPTEPMSVVVDKINQNNLPIRTLRSSHSFDARIRDAKGKEHSFSGDGYVIFRKPGDLLVTAKVLTERAFEVGSNAERYWFIVPRENTMWWGEKRNFDPNKANQLAIRPDLLLEVLGVLDIETNFNQLPVPTMRFNRDMHMYMFTWNTRLPDRWIVEKEVWYDRETFLPQLINLFDDHGRVILRAYLKDHEAIEARPQKIATRFELFFPETKSTLNMRLTDVKEKFKNIPNDATFAFPEEPGVEKVIEIK